MTQLFFFLKQFFAFKKQLAVELAFSLMELFWTKFQLSVCKHWLKRSSALVASCPCSSLWARLCCVSQDAAGPWCPYMSLQGPKTAGDSGSDRWRHPNYSEGKAMSLHNPNYFSLIILTHFTIDTGSYPKNWAKPMDVTGESATKIQ